MTFKKCTSYSIHLSVQHFLYVGQILSFFEVIHPQNISRLNDPWLGFFKHYIYSFMLRHWSSGFVWSASSHVKRDRGLIFLQQSLPSTSLVVCHGLWHWAFLSEHLLGSFKCKAIMTQVKWASDSWTYYYPHYCKKIEVISHTKETKCFIICISTNHVLF